MLKGRLAQNSDTAIKKAQKKFSGAPPPNLPGTPLRHIGSRKRSGRADGPHTANPCSPKTLGVYEDQSLHLHHCIYITQCTISKLMPNLSYALFVILCLKNLFIRFIRAESLIIHMCIRRFLRGFGVNKKETNFLD